MRERMEAFHTSATEKTVTTLHSTKEDTNRSMWSGKYASSVTLTAMPITPRELKKAITRCAVSCAWYREL